MAMMQHKVADNLFLNAGVEEEDLDFFVKAHGLEKDKEFQQIVQDAMMKVQMAQMKFQMS
mgnify:CR=1 FL=1